MSPYRFSLRQSARYRVCAVTNPLDRIWENTKAYTVVPINSRDSDWGTWALANSPWMVSIIPASRINGPVVITKEAEYAFSFPVAVRALNSFFNSKPTPAMMLPALLPPGKSGDMNQ